MRPIICRFWIRKSAYFAKNLLASLKSIRSGFREHPSTSTGQKKKKKKSWMIQSMCTQPSQGRTRCSVCLFLLGELRTTL